MDFGHVADLACPDHLGGLTGAFVRISLVAHLSGDFVLVRRFHQLARFPDGARQRLLHIHVLPAFHALHRRDGVHVIGDGDDHRIDVLAFLVEHLAEVFVLRRFLVFLEFACGLLLIDIAERNDVLGGAAVDIAGRLAARADRGDIQLLVRRFVAQALQRADGAESGRRNRAGQAAIL